MDVFSSDYASYTIGAAVGFGAASIVYAAVHSSTSPPSSPPVLCAVKISSHHPDPEQWREEVRLLSSCRHPNILQIHAAFTIPPRHCQVAIVTPLVAGGSLLSIMAWRATLPSDDAPSGLFRSLSGRGRSTVTNGRLDEEEVRAVLKQVLSGVGYLHSQGIVHRDIKAGNLLVDADGTVLLADLGIGVRSAGASGIPRMTDLAGSPCWMAPEVIIGVGSDYKSDIWSLGITLIELSTGSAPLAHLPPAKILTQIALSPAPCLPPSFNASKPYLSFLASCLVKDPRERANLAQLERHPFLRTARGPAWLAGALLKGVPPLVYRQEIRKIPSHHSLASLATSWNFNPTPAGSTLTTPIRTTHRLPRSSSASTTASGQSYLFAPPYRRRRSVSRSSAGYSVPSSPKASMSRAGWLITPVEGDGGGVDGILPISRAGSEPGRRRAASLIDPNGPSRPAVPRNDEPTPSYSMSALAMSVPMEPSITSLSGDTDLRPITPVHPELSEPRVAGPHSAGSSSSPRAWRGLLSRAWSRRTQKGSGGAA